MGVHLKPERVFTLGQNTHDAALDRARRLLREIKGWETVEHVETTLVGKIRLKLNDPESKKTEAHEQVKGIIFNILKNENIDKNVIFYGCLMVDQLGENIMIEINPEG